MNLKKRIRSLEDYLGVTFKRKDSKDDMEEHGMDDWGKLKTIDDKVNNITKFLEKKFPKEFEDKGRFD